MLHRRKWMTGFFLPKIYIIEVGASFSLCSACGIIAFRKPESSAQCALIPTLPSSSAPRVLWWLGAENPRHPHVMKLCGFWFWEPQPQWLGSAFPSPALRECPEWKPKTENQTSGGPARASRYKIQAWEDGPGKGEEEQRWGGRGWYKETNWTRDLRDRTCDGVKIRLHQRQWNGGLLDSNFGLGFSPCLTENWKLIV